MDPQNTAILTGGELRFLIEQGRLRVEPGSPLEGALGRTPESCRTPQVLSDLWHRALTVLAGPAWCVRTYTPGSAATRLAAFFGPRDGGRFGLVGWWPEGEAVRISFPWSPGEIATQACRVLMAELPFPPDPFSGTSRPEGLFALMAAVDALRAAELSSYLDRRPGATLVYQRSDLRRQLELGLAQGDARWSVTLLRLVTPSPALPGPNLLDAGLLELAVAGLLQLDGERWQPAAPLVRLARYWTPPLPAFAHEVLVLGGGAPQRHSHGVALRGDGPLWLIDYPDLRQPQPAASFRSIDGRQYGKWLETQMQPPAAAPDPAFSAGDAPRTPAGFVRSEPSGPPCPACGGPLPGGPGKFCPHCGARVATPAPPSTCANPGCRQPLPPGSRFCPACGAGVGSEAARPPAEARRTIRPEPTPPRPPERRADSPPPPPAVAVCPNPQCGRPLPAGKKFCTACGARAR